MKVDEALAFVKTKRPIVQPNESKNCIIFKLDFMI
jgi:hypothetical protein